MSIRVAAACPHGYLRPLTDILLKKEEEHTYTMVSVGLCYRTLTLLCHDASRDTDETRLSAAFRRG